METVVGVGAGIIGILLGVIGVITAFVPPKTTKARFAMIAIYIALSAIAAITTVVDQQWSQQGARDNKAQLEALSEKAQQHYEQNRDLSQQNLALHREVTNLRGEVEKAASAPELLANKRTLKREIQGHLTRFDEFARDEKREFENAILDLNGESRSKAIEVFQKQLSSSYFSRYHAETCRLLERAGELRISVQPCTTDARYEYFGDLPPDVDALREIVQALPD